MSAICIVLFCLFSPVAHASTETDVSSCTCKDGITDCSFRMKIEFLDSDICSSTTTLNVRGNNLRQLSRIFRPKSYIPYTKLDASLNEFGMNNFSISNWIVATIDLSSNYLNNLNFFNFRDRGMSLKALNVSNNAISNIADTVCFWNQFRIFRMLTTEFLS